MRKKIIIILPSFFVTICILGVIAIKIFAYLPENPSKEKLIGFFQNNRDTFDKIATYIVGVDGDVSFDKREGKDIESIGRVGNNDKIELFTDENEVKEDVKNLLYKYGFVTVYKEEQFIYFVKYAGFQWHKSIIYSKDGKSPPLHRERDFAELGDGWFYYEGE